MTLNRSSWLRARPRPVPARARPGVALRSLVFSCALVGCAAGCGTASDKADASAPDAADQADTGVVDSASVDADMADIGANDDVATALDASTGDADGSEAATPCKSDKECLAQDRVCDKAASVCVQCNDSNDCGDDEACKSHVCVGPPKACVSSKECAATNQLCDKVAGICVDCLSADDCAAGQGCLETVCVDVVCKPGATACKDTSTLGVCAADGLSVVEVPCPSGQGCAGGLCTTATVCKPGTSACEGVATLLSCNGDGSAWIKTPCEAKHLCATKGGLSLCEVATCTPGALVCVGDKIAECSSSGEPSDISDDCALKGKACEAGVCVAKQVAVCMAGSKSCDGDKAKVCKADASDWEVVDCASLGKTCDAGDCVAKVVTVCTAGAVGCDGPNKAVCKADGTGWDLVGCGPKAACNAGVCEPTLCTPNSQDCVDAKTQKTCAPDGKSWIDVTACASTNVCAESACKANVGCTMTPYADGATCGDGKICTAGACSAPTGCQLCGPTEACVSGQCQACTLTDAPVYVGAVRSFTPPSVQLPGPMELAWSPKHAEWWLVYNHQLGQPGKIVRYNKDWSSTGKEFAIPPYTRSLAVLPDGDFVMAVNPNPGGKGFVKRFKALSQDIVWSIEAKWGDYGVSGVTLWSGKIMSIVGMKFSNSARWATLDPETGAKLSEKTVSSDGGFVSVANGFVFGDNLYSPAIQSMQRWLLAPIIALVTTAAVQPPWYGQNVSFTHGASDGRYGCIGTNAWAGRLFCFDFYPGCGSAPTTTPPFHGSGIMTVDEQTALANLLGTGDKVWTRCAPTTGKPGLSDFASACTGGPTVLVGAQKSTTTGKVAFIGAYSSIGWSPNAGKVSDDKAYFFALPSGLKAVPTNGIATLTTVAKAGPAIDNGMTCTTSQCTFNFKAFSCTDGSAATDCAKAFNGGSVMGGQAAVEMWTLKP